MLNFSTLVAASLMASPVTPLPEGQVSLPIPKDIAIREVTVDSLNERKPICKGCDNFDFLRTPKYEISPERRALLNTIRYAEGTWANGTETGYRILFGGRMVSSLNRHPDRVQYSSGYASAAAGAYQFMPATWEEASRKLSLPTFEPDHQDQAALYLIEKRGALRMADAGQMTPSLANRLAPEWASFPTYRGSSYYGQPVKTFSELRTFYENNLNELRRETNEQTLEAKGNENV
jgi:muramidase (phage lysozyme)